MTKDDLPKCNPADRDEALLPPEKQLPDYKDGDCCTEGCIKCDARKVLAETQEPVAYVDEFGNFEFIMQMWMEEEPNVIWTPLYTSPPSREWVGLSDAEIEEVYEKVSAPMGERRIYEVHTLAKALDAKLKEKNDGGM